jgi:hypothetical protein
MNTLNLIELSHTELITINGGVNEEAYNTGYAIGSCLRKMVKNFFTLVGIRNFFAVL